MKGYQITLTNKKKYLLTEKEGEMIKDILERGKRQMITAYNDMFPSTLIATISLLSFDMEEASKEVKEHFSDEPKAPEEPWQKLPTGVVILTADADHPEDFSKAKVYQRSRIGLQKAGKPYWLCEAHYEMRDERQYILDFHKVPSANLCVVEDGESVLKKAYCHGVPRF